MCAVKARTVPGPSRRPTGWNLHAPSRPQSPHMGTPSTTEPPVRILNHVHSSNLPYLFPGPAWPQISAHSRLPRGVRPRLEGKPRTPLSSRVATRGSKIKGKGEGGKEGKKEGRKEGKRKGWQSVRRLFEKSGTCVCVCGQSSPRVARESWGWRSSHCRA